MDLGVGERHRGNEGGEGRRGERGNCVSDIKSKNNLIKN